MTHIAVDIGASSGRLVVGKMVTGELVIEEIHRFANGFREMNGTNYWDIEHLLKQILVGLQKAKQRGYDACTVGIDTWAVDYVLVGQDGKRLQEVVSYRDSRTNCTMEKVSKQISKAEIYQKTGIQFLSFNTLYQLYEEDFDMLSKAKHIMLVPDYLGFCLTDNAVTEVTNASTMQLLNPLTQQFDSELLEVAGVTADQFPPLVQPGTVIGSINHASFPAYNLPNCTLIAVASHDTASAIVGTPADGSNWAYLSSGTWSLLGSELKEVVINEQAQAANYTNEWGAAGTYRFLKNIMGLWVIQEVRRKLPKDYSFSEFVAMARQAAPFQQYINFNDDRFLNPANMIDEIQKYCQETNQKVPVSVSELASAVFHNLAVIYAVELEQLEQLIGSKVERLHIVGGGSQNDLLNQCTADLCGLEVTAGPVEATSIGNLVVQLVAAGEIPSIAAGRRIIADSFPIKKYEPQKIDRQAIKKAFQDTILMTSIKEEG